MDRDVFLQLETVSFLASLWSTLVISQGFVAFWAFKGGSASMVSLGSMHSPGLFGAPATPMSVKHPTPPSSKSLLFGLCC